MQKIFPNCPQNAQTDATVISKWPQSNLKVTPKSPKVSPKRPKVTLKCPQRDPKPPYSDPRSPPYVTSDARVSPKSLPSGANVSQSHPKVTPKSPKISLISQKWRQSVPQSPQNHQKWTKNHLKPIKMFQNQNITTNRPNTIRILMKLASIESWDRQFSNDATLFRIRPVKVHFQTMFWSYFIIHTSREISILVEKISILIEKYQCWSKKYQYWSEFYQYWSKPPSQ